MIPTKSRENRRMKALKLPKNLERRYKETKCRDCTVVVTRMDFAKILGKFTKVKIQYETNTSTRSRRPMNQVSPNTRSSANENGIVQGSRHAYNTYSGKKTPGPKKQYHNETSSPKTSNILKENNRLIKKTDNVNNKFTKSTVKHYGIIFEDPKTVVSEEVSSISLDDLIPNISKSILPSEDWCIDYVPSSNEVKDDKIYDRIAAELEDLMYSEKTKQDGGSKDDSKTDEFPSIMDILNDNPKEESPNKPAEVNSITLETNDVEAMLLGNSEPKPTPMEVDSTDVSSFLTGIEPSSTADSNKDAENPPSIEENPESPSILTDELAEIPKNNTSKKDEQEVPKAEEEIEKTEEKPPTEEESVVIPVVVPETTESAKTTENNDENTPVNVPVLRIGVTQVVFKKNNNGNCVKTVTCPKNLKYSISVTDKSIELLGAPKVISSLEDLQVLLQIVDECELNSLYVLH